MSSKKLPSKKNKSFLQSQKALFGVLGPMGDKDKFYKIKVCQETHKNWVK